MLPLIKKKNNQKKKITPQKQHIFYLTSFLSRSNKTSWKSASLRHLHWWDKIFKDWFDA